MISIEELEEYALSALSTLDGQHDMRIAAHDVVQEVIERLVFSMLQEREMRPDDEDGWMYAMEVLREYLDQE